MEALYNKVYIYEFVMRKLVHLRLDIFESCK